MNLRRPVLLARFDAKNLTVTNLRNDEVFKTKFFACVENHPKKAGLLKLKSVGNDNHRRERSKTIYPVSDKVPYIQNMGVFCEIIEHAVKQLLGRRLKFQKPKIVLNLMPKVDPRHFEAHEDEDRILHDLIMRLVVTDRLFNSFYFHVGPGNLNRDTILHWAKNPKNHQIKG